MMTTIAIVASGSRGDVQPYVALGQGLQAVGYDVRLLTVDDFAALVQGAGLTHCSIGASIEATLQRDAVRHTIEGGNFLAIANLMRRETKANAQAVAQRLPSLLQDADLMIAGVGGMMGAFSIAEHLNIPTVQAYVFPMTPTRAFPGPLTPRVPFGRVLNPLSFHAVRQVIWQMARAGDAATRRELGLSGAPLRGPFADLRRQGAPVLYGYSSAVIPRPPDWDTSHHVTGYWFLDAADDWQPPARLVEFLNAGEPPVYIGFGSMVNRDPETITRIAIDALQRSGQRGVLAAGWGGMHADDMPDTIYMLKSAPHSWLFPQMAAVVHHGGAGTTAAGLRAGVPSIVVPFMGDQPFWGWRAHALGVGPEPIPRKQLTAERLSAAITRAMSDAVMRQRAAALGDRIRAEDGVGEAAEIIQRL